MMAMLHTILTQQQITEVIIRVREGCDLDQHVPAFVGALRGKMPRPYSPATSSQGEKRVGRSEKRERKWKKGERNEGIHVSEGGGERCIYILKHCFHTLICI